MAKSQISIISWTLTLTLGLDLAHLQGDQGTQIGLQRTESLSQLPDEIAPPGCRHGPPVEEGLMGPVHDPVIFVLGDLLNGRDDRSIDGSCDLELGARAHPFSAESAEVALLDAEALQDISHRFSYMDMAGHEPVSGPVDSGEREQVRSPDPGGVSI